MTPLSHSGSPREQRTESLSTAELVRRASGQLSSLVRDEMALARAELTVKAKHAGIGAGLFGTAGVIGLYGLFGVLAGVVLLIARVIPDWGAALAFGGLLVLLAGMLGLAGRRQLRRVPPPVPEAATSSLRADAEALRSAAAHQGEPR
ncbi:phage holin family protein [Rugosimonospora acidiphila]|uniref:Phage holin family protein n=1 Tax=Rugosimonospora acidiphila TaxID=556531 RepID=A0ABP9SG62_9ACTN